MKFAYTGKGVDGETVEGKISASDLDEARQLLASQGITPSSISAVSANPNGGGRLSAEQIGRFCDQLASVLDSGLPISRAVAALAEDAKDKRLHRALEEIAAGLESGKSLDQLVGQHSHLFPPLMPAMLAAGEKSGNLPEVLRLIAVHEWRMAELSSRIKGALAYPVFVLAFSFLLFSGVLHFVIPKYAELSETGIGFSFNTPPTSQMLFWLSRHSEVFFISVIVLCLALVVIWKYMSYFPKLISLRERILFYLPIYGNFLKSVFLSRFCRTLGLLLDTGVPLDQSLRTLLHNSHAIESHCLINELVLMVEKGKPFSRALEEYAHIYTSGLVCMVKTGEESGNLSGSLHEAASFTERQAERESNLIHSVLPPVLTIFVAVIVAIFIGALFAPILSIISNFGVV